MKKDIEIINKELGIYRVTTLGERWYARPSLQTENGMPEYEFFPSITWIAGHYPKGIGFYKWLADRGWDESQALKEAAGDKGSKVHYACSDVDKGMRIDVVNGKYLNPSTRQPENLSVEEVDCILSYRNFIEEYQPYVLADEITGFGENYAGTADKVVAFAGEAPGSPRQIAIIDLKTSKAIWEEYRLQISALSHMGIDYAGMGITDEEWANRKLFILQLGYKLNRAGFKLTLIEDKYPMFQVAWQLWKNENPDARPKEAVYPLFIESPFRIGQIKGEIVPAGQAKAKPARKAIKQK